MIEVSGLEKRYDRFVAVTEVDFTIRAGEIVGLLGPNGAGKTTIMKILTCYLYPSAGKVSIKGLDVYSQALEIKRNLGYLPENAPLYPELNVKEYLSFIAQTRIGKGTSPSGLTAVQASEKAAEDCALQDVWLKGIDTLSKGYRQRVGLAQAILHEPDILILDEPTTGLDPNQIVEIRRLITNIGKKKTVILSSHILQEVEAVCSRVLILNKGRIVAQGTTEEIGNELRGDLSCRAVVKGDHPAFAEALKRVSGHIRARTSDLGNAKVSGHSNIAVFEITCPRTYVKSIEELQETIFDTAVTAGVKILELGSTATSLEDVFLSLTAQGPDAEAESAEVFHE